MGSSSLSVRAIVTVFFLSVMVVAAWPAGPAAAADGAQAPAKRQTGSISGTVTDESMNPLAYKGVEVYRPGGGYVSGGSAQSDYSTGEYEITGLDDGTYFVRGGYSGDDWVVELYGNVPCPNNNCWTDAGTPVYVSGGGAVTGIDFQLAEAGSIRGSVLRAGDGDDMNDARVTVFDPGSTWDDGEVGSDNVSYDSGTYVYEVRGLPAGCYFASAEPESDSSERNSAPTAYPDVPLVWQADAPLVGDPIAVVAGEQTSGVDITLQPGSVIVVQVTDEAGRAPLAESWLEIWVKTLSGQWEHAWEGGGFKRDASGIFLAEGLGAGEYAVITGVFPEEEGPPKAARQTRDSVGAARRTGP